MIPQLLTKLNKDQKEAVVATKGPIIILAGAGSGKTRVLTYKVAYLITEKQVNPNNILMVTFTNKAALEMIERIKKLVGNSNIPLSGTFHSIAAKILRTDGKYIGISPSYVIYDENDQIDAVKQVMIALDISSKNFNPKAVSTTISQAKNELIDGGEYLQYARGYFQETVARIYVSYQQFLKKNNALDFDDLLSETVRLLTEVKQIAGKYQERFHYVVVDEYQDTNRAQYEMTKLLGARYRNICIVGDASQSIYSWRGADYKNLVNFQRDFPETQVFHLEQNYRSTQKILQAATNVISHNTSHPVLKLWTQKSDGENITLYEAKNEQEEALFIINNINEIVKISSNNISLNDFAVLYRTNAQSRSLEEAFLHTALPYRLVGGVRFYERKEIKDILSYLRFIYNPKDSVAYRRIEKIGKRRFDKFIALLDKFKKADREKATTLDLLDAVVNQTSYLDFFDTKTEEDNSRLENIKELRSVASTFPVLSEFLENVALVEQEYFPNGTTYKDNNGQEAVTMLTMHAAKGLEFKVVFIVGMEEGLFPHSQSLLERSELEEERRLCYVALTRAKDRLYLTYTRRRLYFGKSMSNLPSRFIADIPENILTFQTEYDTFF